MYFEQKIPRLTFVSHRKISLDMLAIEQYDQTIQTYHKKVGKPQSLTKWAKVRPLGKST